MAVFSFVSAHLKEHCNANLTLFQQFLVTITKLRFNLCNHDLAYQFGVSQSTISKTFRKRINLNYVHTIEVNHQMAKSRRNS